ncbi:MAG: DUF1016 N-terminal domain-containing protein [Paludibacteraceae bacterium]|nr:DUF1016 N-terminal domain-containing protein [Paludibacteraceae bacterium]
MKRCSSNDILQKQGQLGWGAQVIKQLSIDLRHRFPDDDGYSERNLKYMRHFAAEYRVTGDFLWLCYA